MDKLPYFFVLLKKNVALWTLIATGSFSKIDTVHIEYVRMSPYAMTLKNYAISKGDTFERIWILSGQGRTSINFTTSSSKYQDSMKYYFGTNSTTGSMDGGYTLNDSTIHSSNVMLEPIDIGLDRKAHVFLGRSGEHEYKISLMLYAKDYFQRQDRFTDSLRKADSARYGIRSHSILGRTKPYVARLLDSAMHLGFDMDKRLTDTERIQLAAPKIELINQAIKGDSTYVDAYESKFGREQELKRYDSMIVTGKKILRLAPPDQPEEQIVLRIGESYELTGNIDSARVYHQKALLLYDQEISQSVKNNTGYDDYDMSYKALVLIMLHREQEGRATFKELSENPRIDKDMREYYHNFLVTPRDKFLKEMNP